MTSNAARFTANQPRPAGSPLVRPTPSLLGRLKVSEPVRLYAYSILSAVMVALTLVGALTGEWGDALLGIAAAVLGVVPGAEAARASVYSPRTHFSDLWRAHQAGGASERVERAMGL